MGGRNLNNDEVQTFVYLCLVKASIADVCKSAGVQIANKVITLNLFKKLPGAVLTKIKQKVGFRLVAKFGEKGVVNLVKFVSIADRVIRGSVDFAGTNLIANKAYKIFLWNDME